MYHRICLLLGAGLISACATYPNGPSMMALPGTSSNFDQFRVDDAQCQSYASQGQGAPQQAAQDSGLNSATVGTVVGAAAGALIGSASGNPGAGAAIGAGSGLLLGSAAGSDAYAVTGYRAQERFDAAYVQCMYAKGHQVPVPASAAAAYQQQNSAVANAPPAYGLGSGGYPPPGTPPPPGY
jgi:hypothetical protein